MMNPNGNNSSITSVGGVLVGQITNTDALTGCTVILCPKGTIAGVDQRGGAPGTRETDLLKPMHLVQKIHAIVLSGGSSFGLDAASGVMRYLEEKGVGFETGYGKVPIVPSAILFDLGVGDPKKRPDADMGYLACQQASNSSVSQGNFGAGTGATVGKIFGIAGAMKSGIGSCCINIAGGIKVGAIVAVNAFGDIVDHTSGKIIAGARTIKKGPIKLGTDNYFADTVGTLATPVGGKILQFANSQNTVIGIVATNAYLDKEEANKVAQMAQDGLAMTVRPAHTMFDGDTIFAISTGKRQCDVNIIGAFAAQAVAISINNAVKHAKSIANLPSYQDIYTNHR